jgi:purine-binding chemotaxis protein CheW
MAVTGEPRPAPAPAPVAAPISRAAPRALVFRLGRRVLAALAGAGGRVVEIESWTRVPTGPPHLLGLANAQGAVLPVVDARPLLGLPVTPWPWPLRALVAGGDDLRVALAVEEILGFEPCPDERVTALGDGLPEGLRAHGRGELTLARGRATLIDVPRIIETLRLKRAG